MAGRVDVAWNSPLAWVRARRLAAARVEALGLAGLADRIDDALRLLETIKADVLISDIGMPGRDGYDLIRTIRLRESAAPGAAPHLPAIALTSFARDQDREQTMAAGYDVHCPKPLRPLNLVQQIRHLLDRRN